MANFKMRSPGAVRRGCTRSHARCVHRADVFPSTTACDSLADRLWLWLPPVHGARDSMRDPLHLWKVPVLAPAHRTFLEG